MILRLCAPTTARPFDLDDACVRDAYAALGPTTLVALFLILHLLPKNGPFARTLDALAAPFKTFIPLAAAEAIRAAQEGEGDATTTAKAHANVETAAAPLRRTVVLAAITLSETLIWLAYGSFRSVTQPQHASSTALPLLIGGTWAYATARVILAPRPTPHYDLFALFLSHFAGAALVLSGLVLDAHLGRVDRPLRTSALLAHGAHLAGICTLLLVQLCTPIAVPGPSVQAIGASVSPEDYTTLWGRLTCRWANPLLQRGMTSTLREDDVWPLSSTMQSRVVFERFSAEKRASLLRWLWAANSLDIILDFVLSTCQHLVLFLTRTMN
jgi:hypothetical protein